MLSYLKSGQLRNRTDVHSKSVSMWSVPRHGVSYCDECVKILILIQ